MTRHGRTLQREMRAKSSNRHIDVGAADEKVMVMANVRKTVNLHVGQSVAFDVSLNGSMPVPHTVTFGAEPSPNPLAKVGDPNNYRGVALSSGVLLSAMFGGPATYAVTFTKPGRYHYVCVLHDHMGMVGDVVVKAADG